MARVATLRPQERGWSDLEYYRKTFPPLPPLTPSEEASLIAEFKSTGSKDAEARLLHQWTPFIIDTAMRYKRGNKYRRLGDLISWGHYGFLVGLRKFKPERGYRLSTYVVRWVWHYMDREPRESRFISLPGKTLSLLRRARTLELERERRGLPVGLPDLAAELGVSPERLEKVRDMEKDTRVRFILTTSTEPDDYHHGGNLGQPVANEPSPLEVAERAEREELVREAVKSLTRREQEVINRRWLKAPEETLEAVGHALCLTRERVRQIEMVAQEKLRNLLQSVNA